MIFHDIYKKSAIPNTKPYDYEKALGTLCFICLTVASCDQNDTQTTKPERDNTLAGSISLAGYKMEAECSYDNGNMSITKVSDQEVALFCFAQSDEAAVKISIPRVAVAGLPHDATFDSTVNDAAVALDEQEFMSVRSTVKGRIKEVETRRSSDRGNDPDPATPAYECDISIRCEMEGGVLNFKVLSVEP